MNAGMVNNPGDFRTRAVEVSDQIIRSLDSTARRKLENANISYCIAAPGDASGLVTTLKFITLTSLVFIMLGFFGGFVLFQVAKSLPSFHHALVLGISSAMIFGAVLLMPVPAMAEKRLSRQYIQTHLRDFWSDPDLLPAFVSVENAHTYSKLKVIAEDLGVILIRPEDQCLQIEGIHYRYLICLEDIVKFSLHINGRAMLVSYRIGNEVLELAVIPRSIGGELARKYLGKNELFKTISNLMPARAQQDFESQDQNDRSV